MGRNKSFTVSNSFKFRIFWPKPLWTFAFQLSGLRTFYNFSHVWFSFLPDMVVLAMKCVDPPSLRIFGRTKWWIFKSCNLVLKLCMRLQRGWRLKISAYFDGWLSVKCAQTQERGPTLAAAYISLSILVYEKTLMEKLTLFIKIFTCFG